MGLLPFLLKWLRSEIPKSGLSGVGFRRSEFSRRGGESSGVSSRVTAVIVYV